ncbi:DedA family protein [Terrabacter terrae]|uniref:DedA family protein n=1 Tax=Terrabacter terrae TaxID=318434 RepID=A0ABN2UE77_9MICO
MNGLLFTAVAPLGPFALLLLMGVAFAETGFLAGFLLPADTVVVGAGVLVAAGALQLPMWLSLIGLACAAAAGGQLGYLVGRRLSRRLPQGRESRLVSPQRLAAAQSLFDRYGVRAILLSRFVPLARTLTPVLAGVAGMDRRRFLLHNVIGAGAWAAAMFGGGYWFGAMPAVSGHLDVILLCIAAASILPGLAMLLRTRVARAPSA